MSRKKCIGPTRLWKIADTFNYIQIHNGSRICDTTYSEDSGEGQTTDMLVTNVQYMGWGR